MIIRPEQQYMSPLRLQRGTKLAVGLGPMHWAKTLGYPKWSTAQVGRYRVCISYCRIPRFISKAWSTWCSCDCCGTRGIKGSDGEWQESGMSILVSWAKLITSGFMNISGMSHERWQGMSWWQTYTRRLDCISHLPPWNMYRGNMPPDEGGWMAVSLHGTW